VQLTGRLALSSNKKRLARSVTSALIQLRKEGRYPSWRSICSARGRSFTLAQAELVRDIVSTAQRQYRMRMLAKEKRTASRAKKVIESIPVGFPINRKGLARKIGTTDYFLSTRPACAGLIEAARERSNRYWSSFGCPNKQCDNKYHAKHGATMRIVKRRYWLRGRNHCARVLLECTGCGKWLSVRVAAISRAGGKSVRLL
jgi:hypothetical protein